MSGRDIRDRWRLRVAHDGSLSDGTRVLLFVLAEHMREDGYVSVPRPQLAKWLGRHPNKVVDRLQEAMQRGYLDRVAQGRRGRTAEYRALLPVAAKHPQDRGAIAGMHPQDRGPVIGVLTEVPHAQKHPDIGGPSSKRNAAPEPHAQQEPGQCTSELLSEEVEVDATPDELAAMHRAAKALAALAGEDSVPLVRLRVVA